MKRVVVTGLGAITPIGVGVENFWNGIKEGKVGIKKVDRFDVSDYKAKVAGQIDDFDAKEHMDPKAAKRMERFCQFAVAAAKEAVADANLDIEKEDPYMIGVPVAQAVTTLRDLPFAPSAIDTFPAAIFVIISGTRSGSILPGPLSRSLQ